MSPTGWYRGIVFGGCSGLVSSRTPGILTAVFRGFPQLKSGVAVWLRHGRFQVFSNSSLFIILPSNDRSKDSSVGIAASYGLDERGVGVRRSGRAKNFLFFTSSRPALRPTQRPIVWVPGALSPGVNRPGRGADRSPPASAEVEKTRILTSTLRRSA
jgi:hypothetical protein